MQHKEKGVTLLELLIVLMIFTVMYAAVASLLQSGLSTSVKIANRAEIDTSVQKTLQVITDRLKEASWIVTSSVTIKNGINAGDPYVVNPRTTNNTWEPVDLITGLVKDKIMVFEVPNKNTGGLCRLYAYYTLPTTNLTGSTLDIERRLERSDSKSQALIQARSAEYTCTGTRPSELNEVRLVASSLYKTAGADDGFRFAYLTDTLLKVGYTLTLQGYAPGSGSTSVLTREYGISVYSRNVCIYGGLNCPVL